ncbi:MAG: hypothetical protein ABUJ92_00715 [Desulfobacterales bacterium]
MGSKYQESHREQQCCFGQVSGHHLKIGKSQNSKSADAMAIPVCVTHHQLCELVKISKHDQIRAWQDYMLERLIQKYGRDEGCKQLSDMYGELIDGA